VFAETDLPDFWWQSHCRVG